MILGMINFSLSVNMKVCTKCHFHHYSESVKSWETFLSSLPKGCPRKFPEAAHKSKTNPEQIHNQTHKPGLETKRTFVANLFQQSLCDSSYPTALNKLHILFDISSAMIDTCQHMDIIHEKDCYNGTEFMKKCGRFSFISMTQPVKCKWTIMQPGQFHWNITFHKFYKTYTKLSGVLVTVPESDSGGIWLRSSYPSFTFFIAANKCTK